MERFTTLLVTAILVGSIGNTVMAAADGVIFEDPYATTNTGINDDYATRQTASIKSTYTLDPSSDISATINSEALDLSSSGASGVAVLDHDFGDLKGTTPIFLSVDVTPTSGNAFLLWDEDGATDPSSALSGVSVAASGGNLSWTLYFGGTMFDDGSVTAGTVELFMDELNDILELSIGGTLVSSQNSGNGINFDGFDGTSTSRAVSIGVDGGASATFDNLTVAIPEPASFALLAIGGASLLIRRRRAA